MDFVPCHKKTISSHKKNFDVLKVRNNIMSNDQYENKFYNFYYNIK